MSLTTLGLINGILAGLIVVALAYVCRFPFRLDRVTTPPVSLEDEPDRDEMELAA
jgi:uncharacterized membrane protein